MATRGAAFLAYLRNYHSKRRAVLKAHGTCVDCGADPAEAGHVLCRGCRLARSDREKKRYWIRKCGVAP